MRTASRAGALWRAPPQASSRGGVSHTRANDKVVLIPRPLLDCSTRPCCSPGINFGEPTSFSYAIFGLPLNGTGAGDTIADSSKTNGALGVSGGTEASNDQQAKLDALKVRSHNVVHAMFPPQHCSSRTLSRTTGAELTSLTQSRHANPEARKLL
jgi:hypothetical protein